MACIPVILVLRAHSITRKKLKAALQTHVHLAQRLRRKTAAARDPGCNRNTRRAQTFASAYLVVAAEMNVDDIISAG